MQQGRLISALTCSFSGADDGIRTRDPHLGNRMADVSYVSAGLTSAPELRVLGALGSSVSPVRPSRLDFVGDFVGAFPARADLSRDGEGDRRIMSLIRLVPRPAALTQKDRLTSSSCAQ
jgi:hypothetical protein